MSSKQKGIQTIFWWVIWIAATIASFFIAAALWTPIIADRFGSIHEGSAAIIWVASVFGTWMVFLVPLIVFMYQKVDKAYEDARINREKAALRFRSLEKAPETRQLPANLAQKLEGQPEAIDGGHLVTVKLKDGRSFEYVYIYNKSEILGIYDQREMPFEASEVEDLELTDLSNLPVFAQNKWLRLDGVQAPD